MAHDATRARPQREANRSRPQAAVTVRAVSFARIAGSSALYDALGDLRAMGLITRCLVALEEQVYLHRGEVVKTVGEDILCLFPDCNAAATAAVGMQQRVERFAQDSSVALGLCVGLHCGPLIQEQGDVFGDGVNIAARLMELADPGQILVDGDSMSGLRAPLRRRARALDRRRVKGKSSEIEIIELGWRKREGEPFTTEQTTVLERACNARVVLHVEGRAIILDRSCASFTIGRDAVNDLSIASRKASRQHARIEWRRDKFVLFDHSTNGTYVRIEGAQPVLVKHESFLLHGSGLLGIGEALLPAPGRGAIEFACS